MPDGSVKSTALDRIGEEEIDGRGTLGLTERQAAFVKFFVLLGGNASEAAKLAGYASPGPAGYVLKNLPHVASAIARAVRNEIECDGYRAAWGVLKLALDGSVECRFSDRLKAAFKVVDLVHARQARRHEGEKAKDLGEMSPDELRAVMADGMAALEKLADEAKPAGKGKGE